MRACCFARLSIPLDTWTYEVTQREIDNFFMSSNLKSKYVICMNILKVYEHKLYTLSTESQPLI